MDDIIDLPHFYQLDRLHYKFTLHLSVHVTDNECDLTECNLSDKSDPIHNNFVNNHTLSQHIISIKSFVN